MALYCNMPALGFSGRGALLGIWLSCLGAFGKGVASGASVGLHLRMLGCEELGARAAHRLVIVHRSEGSGRGHLLRADRRLRAVRGVVADGAGALMFSGLRIYIYLVIFGPQAQARGKHGLRMRFIGDCGRGCKSEASTLEL